MGYNPRFIYPKTGGIECLPLALARPVRRVHLNETLESIDPKRKVVRMASGREEPYDSLITSLPLPETFRLLKDTPETLRYAASLLRAIGVFNINIGIDRPNVSDQHWIYYPEGQYIFSRVGFPMNFSTAVAPAGTSSMYIEITYQPGQKPNPEEAYARSIADLQRCGILRESDRILTRLDLDIKTAYIVFDEHRQTHLQSLIGYLESRDIHTAGRYGQWDYYSMEDSIRSGKTIAEKVAPEIQVMHA
jgi:UDP-galactopyranose mutase